MTEDIINQIDGQVQIVFTKGFEGQLYGDALWMSLADYDTTSAETIESMKQARYDTWLAVIAAMPNEAPAEPPQE